MRLIYFISDYRFSVTQKHLKMLVIQFLILSSLTFVTSGWGVLNYPEFIKHLEEIEKYREDVLNDEQGHGRYYRDVDKKTDTVTRFGKSLAQAKSSNKGRGMARMLNLMKRSFSTSLLRKHGWNKLYED